MVKPKRKCQACNEFKATQAFGSYNGVRNGAKTCRQCKRTPKKSYNPIIYSNDTLSGQMELLKVHLKTIRTYALRKNTTDLQLKLNPLAPLKHVLRNSHNSGTISITKLDGKYFVQITYNASDFNFEFKDKEEFAKQFIKVSFKQLRELKSGIDLIAMADLKAKMLLQ